MGGDSKSSRLVSEFLAALAAHLAATLTDTWPGSRAVSYSIGQVNYLTSRSEHIFKICKL